MFKKLSSVLVFSLAALLISNRVMASADVVLDKAPNRINNLPALQHGAKLFVNYCLSCHSAQSMRFNRLTDLGLTEEQIRNNLLFTTDKVGDNMKIAMTAKDGKEWFGALPPDLSVIARARSSGSGSGADWIYTYLRSYYRDNTTPTGWNNLTFPNVGMPHVLWERQGERELTTVAIHPASKEANEKHPEWEKITTTYDTNGFMTRQVEPLAEHHGHSSFEANFTPKDKAKSLQYDEEVADLVAYLSYMSEPAQQTRKRLGVWVLLFLGIFALIACRLNASFWKDIK